MCDIIICFGKFLELRYWPHRYDNQWRLARMDNTDYTFPDSATFEQIRLKIFGETKLGSVSERGENYVIIDLPKNTDSGQVAKFLDHIGFACLEKEAGCI